ncbi:TonB-dependent receptor [Colwelliaceae bacterium BS250]
MKKQEMKLGLLAAAVIAAISGNAMAQEAQDEQSQKAKEEAKQIETIEVTGVRSQLSDALLKKRMQNTIGEAISADDIGTLPALDLAEALQVIPGVQVNRENDDGAFRSGEISLRGLPGSFTAVTANGQTFAAPSGSVRPEQGVPNPFSAFASGVFDGVWVSKSQRADLIEGGIAGTVDKKLAHALSKKDGFVVRATATYEEAMDETSPNYFISGTKHLIEDRLAVTFKFDRQDEEFRRDNINFTRYQALNTGRFPGLEDWKAENNINAEDEVLIPGGLRQYSELRSGRRDSFTGNIEFQATDNLKVGADLLYTDRDLDINTEILLTSTHGGTTDITPTSTPFLGFTDPQSGKKSYVLPGYDFENVNMNEGQRAGKFEQESKGLFLYAQYDQDDWVIDVSLAHSEATFLRMQNNVQTQFRAEGGSRTNGVTGSINSGSGNISDYELSISGLNTNLDVPYAISSTPYDDNFASSTEGPRQRFFSAGNEVYRDRTDTGFNIDIEKTVDLGPIDSVKFGGRYNEQEIESHIFYMGVAGLSTAGLSNDLFAVPEGVKNNDFFGGGASGAFTDGWRTLVPNVNDAWFVDGVDNPLGLATSPHTGAIYLMNKNSMNQRGLDQSGDTKTKITALYAMANLDSEVFGLNMRGNVGVRYVNTDLDGTGVSTVNGQYEQGTAKSSYDNFLPAINLSFELQEDLYLRVAYSKALNRPNPAGFTPGTSITETEYDGEDPDGLGKVEIVLPGTDLDAYTADNYDMSLEWYNTESSLISLALYRKEVEGYYDRESYCPQDGGGYGYGTMELVDIGGGGFDCVSSEGYKMNISKVVNLDETITIDGIELSAQQDLSFLDGWVSHFGVLASLSLIDFDGEDEEGEPLDIPKISDKSYNIVGYWDNGTFSTRLAYNWRSEYALQGAGSFTGIADRKVKERGQFDLSLRYNVNDNLILSLSGFNLTDELYEEYQSENPDMNRLTAYDGRTYKASVTYKF